jgi:lysozyme family protein
MSFEKSVEFVLKHEGGYVNDPDDPGGETKYGISKRAYPNLNIKNLKIEHAKEIYKKDYWDKIKDHCIESFMPIVFDTAVNCGPSRALKFYKEAATAYEYATIRISFYLELCRKNKTMKKFLYGWVKRTIEALGLK